MCACSISVFICKFKSEHKNTMDEIKFVIDELNKAPFNKNLNLIGYDGMREEQRLDILVQVLNVIDPKLNLPSVRLGNMEEIATAILDTLRIFKYSPPIHINPVEFRRDLILGDKDLLTNILNWLLMRLPALKKRAYLARFLVKIELSPEVEGDQNVLVIYEQYLRLIEDFKKTHSNYEKQKKSLDSLIELQKDIKTMDFEKDQVRNKLETMRRRVNLDSTNDSNVSAMFNAAKLYAEARFDNEKLERQLKEQSKRIDAMKSRIEEQQSELNEMASNEFTTGILTPENMLTKLEEDVMVKRRLAKEVLPAELEEVRSIVRDIEAIEQQSDTVLKEYHAKITAQIELLNREVAELMERKILNTDNDHDRLLHYRQNAKSVAEKREETQKQFANLEKSLEKQQIELENLRSKFNDGDLPVHGDALKLYIDKISKRDSEMQDKKNELAKLEKEVSTLEGKLADLKRQDVKVMREINEFEESLGIHGYFRMKESSLEVVIDDNDDGIEDNLNEMNNDDIERVNAHMVRLEEALDIVKEQLLPLMREVKQLRQVNYELNNEFEMKKRMYDSAAAGLEAELSRCEAELFRMHSEQDQLSTEQFQHQTELIVAQSERDWFHGATSLMSELNAEIERESALQRELKEREREIAAKEDYYHRQINMWRDLKALLEIKAKILDEKREEKARNDYMISANYNHLVL